MAVNTLKNRIVKPKNQRVKRVLKKRESKVHENDKNTMFIKGGRSSDKVSSLLKNLYLLKKPLAVFFKRKNMMRPFEDSTSIEFFSDKAESSLFMFGSHSKKRPDNIVIGRLFDYHILDMVELGIDKFKAMEEFKQGSSVVLGNKPCLLFAGEAFDQDQEHKRLKNLLIDIFRGPTIENVRLAGLEHIFQFTAAEGKIFLRSYRVQMKKSGSRTPRIELSEMGPSVDFVLRRTHMASDDLFKRAKKVPAEIKAKKKKNISHDAFGTKEARIHMQRQDFDKLQIRKMKGLKRKKESASLKTKDTPAKKTKT